MKNFRVQKDLTNGRQNQFVKQYLFFSGCFCYSIFFGSCWRFVISPSTGKRARSLNRQAISSEIKQSFTPPTYAVVLWDGKIIKDSMDQNKEDVAVAISGSPDCKNGKLFGVEKTESSSGVNQANAVSNLLEEWNCSDNVIGLSFDTTSSNTGRINGAAVLLENRLHKKLL